MVGVSDRASRNRDFHPVQESDPAQDEQPEDKKPTHSACVALNHAVPFTFTVKRANYYAECSRRILVNWVATILYCPGCSINEFMERPGFSSPLVSTIDGLDSRSSFDTC